MSNTIEKKSIDEYLADINRRISRLETGSRKSVDISPIADFSVTLDPGEGILLDISLAWDDPNLAINPHGNMYWSLYIDTDNSDLSYWPIGDNIASILDHIVEWRNDLPGLVNGGYKSSESQLFLANLDGGSAHTYYLHTAFTYNSGQSGGGLG